MKYDFDLDERRITKQLVMKIGITCVEVLLVIFVAFAITHYGLATMNVSGENMSPTLKDGDHILINKMSYKIHKVKRNDVIVVEENGSEHSYFSLERVIGLPGETVLIKKGYVYINNKKLKEKLDFPVMENGGLALEKIKLEDDEYFVLGDNRNECQDSRNANIGNVLKDDIVGKAWFRTNSLGIISKLDEFNTNTESSSSEDSTSLKE